jgi:hypothetical protein
MAQQQQNQLDLVIQGIGNLVNAMQQQPAQPAARPREISLVKIEPFYGDDQDPISWLEDFEKASVANGYTEERKLAIVRAYLKGTAAAWLNQRMQNQATCPTVWNSANPAANETSFTVPFKARFRSGSQIAAWQHQLDSTY